MKLKKDKYSKARGGKSKLLNISCSNCKPISAFTKKMAQEYLSACILIGLKELQKIVLN